MSDRWDWQVDDEWDRAERANDRAEWADHIEAWRVARDDVLNRDLPARPVPDPVNGSA